VSACEGADVFHRSTRVFPIADETRCHHILLPVPSRRLPHRVRGGVTVADYGAGSAAASRAAAGVDRALADVVQATDAHLGAVYLLVPEEQVLRMVVVTGVSGRIATSWARVALAAPVPVADVARRRKPVWINSHEELARRYPRTALALPYHVAMSVDPLISGSVLWGVVLLLWPGTRAGELSETEEREITDAGRRMSRSLLRASDEGSPVRPGSELRALDARPSGHWEQAEAQAGAGLTERFLDGYLALDLDGRVTFLNRRSTELLGAGREDLLGSRPWEALPWLHDPAYENPYLASLFSRLPTSFIAQRPPDRWLSFRLYPDASGVSMHITNTEAPTGEQRPRVVPPTAGLARAGSFFYLLHLAYSLTEAVGERDETDAVTDQIMPVIDAQGLALLSVEEGRLRSLSSRGFPHGVPGSVEGETLPSDTPCIRATTSRTPLFFDDKEQFRNAFPLLDLGEDVGAIAYLPLIVSGRAIGCCVLGFDRPHAFSPDERAALRALAGMIAQALERARLYDTKNQVARALQAALLPHVLPRVPGLQVAARYAPANRGMDIGGDFYDLIRLDESTAAAVIGDVQGHNVNAAALMGQLRTAVHAHASAGARPDEVLARTNRLFNDLNSNLFASCLYAQIDLRTGKALLANAGHPPPVLSAPDRPAEVLDLPPGLLLGIEYEADYRTTEIDLPPATVLALYTDGLVERPGLDLGTSIDDLADQLTRAAARPLDDLADAVVGKAQLTSQGSDDIALLFIKRQMPEGPA
jgi:serine phosphatase RsbU (regulator of sigma subunit)/PAS domain-containing protein